MSRAPPPKRTRTGSCSFASASSSSRCSKSRSLAPWGSATSTTWTWAIITGSSAEQKKPPCSRATGARLLAAATTDGSSVAIGTR